MPANIDPKTGMPVELIRTGKKQARISELEKEAQKGTEIVSALRSKAGLLFEKECNAILEKQIREFVQKDPTCQGIISVLRAIGGEIQSAQGAAEKLAREQLRSQ